MSIQEPTNGGPNEKITINKEDLREILIDAIEYRKQELKDAFKKEKEETYLTINQVSLMLRVDKSTLYRWNKIKYLVRIAVGGGRRYRLSDINAILNGGPL